MAVICSDIAGCVPDLVIDSITGLRVPARNPEKLASAMTFVAKQADRTKHMGRLAAQKIEGYSPDACATGMVAAAIKAELRACIDEGMAYTATALA